MFLLLAVVLRLLSRLRCVQLERTSRSERSDHYCVEIHREHHGSNPRAVLQRLTL